MGYLELDVELSDEAKAMQETARKFGMEVMRPAGIELDKLADPADVIAEGSVLWDMFKQHRELGFHKMGIPKAAGGMMEDMPPMARTLIAEQMGYADVGLAVSLGVSGMPFNIAMMVPDPDIQKLVREYAEDTEAGLIGCWGITEPDHGSDWVIGTTSAGADPRLVPSLRGELKGDEYILNGRKSAWVSNGTIATHAVLHVGLDPSKGIHGHGLAICPLDLPGISRGKPLDKIGQRPLNQGEIIFEEVKLPKSYMFISDPAIFGSGMGKMFLGTANTGMGVLLSGLAQAAFDEALKYAKERIQGGVPIIEHQNIKLKLFKMFSMVESARAFARRVSKYNVAQGPMRSSPAHGITAKVLSTETAFTVASEAIQILGGYGLTKEYPVEKMFRDARASMIEDGTNEALALAAAEDF